VHTSRPERTRSLPNLNLKSSYEYFRVKTPFNLARVGCFKEQLDCLLEIRTGRLDCFALAGDIELRAKTDIPSAIALNNRCQLLSLFHRI